MTNAKEALSTTGVVAANPKAAARVGARILEMGGNAMDAASATSMACCMLQPRSTGVGGYVCCAVVREGKSGNVWSLDANSIAPAAAHERMYRILPKDRKGDSQNEREYHCRVEDEANIYGPLAVGPPGMMAGMGVVWEKWGRLEWREIVEPSLRLLSDGFPYASTADAIRSMEPIIRKFPATAEHLMPSGKLPQPDDIWHRRDMEITLQRVADAGWRDFYGGEIGRKIAAYIQSAGGILTREDMENFEPRVTEPYRISFRDATVYGPILTNGCISSLQILNMLDCLEPISEDTPEYWHRYAEVLKLAWRDRLRYLGDPAFADVPIDRFLSKDYAAGRVETLKQFPDSIDTREPPSPPEGSHGTLHVSTADREGNLVSMTISQGSAFGSCVTVPGTGIILGHAMFRFDPRPGRTNSVGPGKRPLNNTAAMIARLPERDVAVGLPGGRRIISVMPRALQLIVERGFSGQEAAHAPRMHMESSEPIEIVDAVDKGVIEALSRMGHEVKPVASIGGAMNCAEVLKQHGRLRAGGSGSAACA